VHELAETGLELDAYTLPAVPFTDGRFTLEIIAKIKSKPITKGVVERAAQYLRKFTK
jgi:hypothetical protein